MIGGANYRAGYIQAVRRFSGRCKYSRWAFCIPGTSYTVIITTANTTTAAATTAAATTEYCCCCCLYSWSVFVRACASYRHDRLAE